MKICPYCKTENHDEASVCKVCGKGISKYAIQGEKFEAAGNLIEGLGCLLTVIGVIVVIVMIIIFTH